MSRWKFAFAATIVVLSCALLASCAVRRLTPCLVGDPGVQVMTIQFVCPNMGASYETTVIKCPWDRHFRMNFVCQLCGHRHYYDLTYLPYPYRWNDYYFYGGHWYSSYYWQRHWSYMNRPPSYRPGQPRRINPPPSRPPEGPMRDQQMRPPARSPEGPTQDPQRSRELRSPTPSAPRYVQPAPSRPPRPESIRVAPPATPSPSPARGQSPRGSRSR